MCEHENPAAEPELEETAEAAAAAEAAEPEEKAAEAAVPEEEPSPRKTEPEKPDAAEKKYAELNDRYLRMLAEYDNFRKRSQREKDAVYPAAVAGTVEKFLPVMDAFERALACECGDADFKKGVDMIYDSLLKALEELGVSAFGEAGDTFDANLHNAVMHVEDESLGTNVVSMVMQKGYRIGERVLRYAMVSVAN